MPRRGVESPINRSRWPTGLPSRHCAASPPKGRDTGAVKRAVVRLLAKIDEAVDEVLYRPAVVKVFQWAPRWWLCDLAKLSMALDDHWNVGYWEDAGIVPGAPCEACGRRASIHVVGGWDGEERGEGGAFLDDRPVYLCGWCQIRGDISSHEHLQAALTEARACSVAWRWRWHVRQ